MRKIFIVFNLLYKYFFPVYRILYFSYKYLSDRKEISNLKNCINKDSVILDIGANIGFYTLLFSKLVGPKGLVLAFEPDKSNFNKLLRIKKNRSNIQIYNYAISDSTQEINLYVSSKLNVDHHTFDDGENREIVKVKAVSIDDFLDDNYPNRTIDFIKMDIQGYDYFALKGMKKTILKSESLILTGEYWPYGLYKAKLKPADYYYELISCGFEVNFMPLLSIEEIEKNYNNVNYYVNFMAIKRPNNL